MQPLCFVLMPHGRQSAGGGPSIDFERVYRDLVTPAVRAAGLDPLRTGDLRDGAAGLRRTLEHLTLCEYAVVDSTNVDAAVVYGLGLRHGLRPAGTVLLSAAGSQTLPIDIAASGAMLYGVGPDGAPTDLVDARERLTLLLRTARDRNARGSVYQLVERFPDIQRLKTDVFRDRVDYSQALKTTLAQARRQGPDAVRAVERALGSVGEAEAAVVIDLLLSYRAVKAWQEMIDLVPRMAAPLAASVMVQEQLGFALNRAGRGEEAERVLLAVIARHGPSSETSTLLGRVYKDAWEAAQQAGEAQRAGRLLDQAIDAYLSGYQSDMRDAFPGINATTLMELREPPDPRRLELLPVVSYAVKLRVSAGQSDYWDHATLLELAVLRRDEGAARAAAADALARVREVWEPQSTARNLRLIREARQRRGEPLPWALALEQALARAQPAAGT